MSHITIVINKALVVPEGDSTVAEPTGVTYVNVSYTPEDSMTDEQVAHKLKQIYRQVRDLGA